MTNKPTDNEIIKALECCAIDYCNDCPLANEDIEEIGCDVNIHFVALDIIDRLKAENERLEQETHWFADIGKMYSEIKAEAIKEFAERLKANITINNTDDGYLMYSVDYNCLMDDIDDLVKEMVGDTE